MDLSGKLWKASRHVLDVAEHIRFMRIWRSELENPGYAKSLASEVMWCMRKLKLAAKHLEEIASFVRPGR